MSLTLVENDKLKRKISTENKVRKKQRAEILGLRKQVNVFKTKVKRMEHKLRESKEKSIENSGLDVR